MLSFKLTGAQASKNSARAEILSLLEKPELIAEVLIECHQILDRLGIEGNIYGRSGLASRVLRLASAATPAKSNKMPFSGEDCVPLKRRMEGRS